MWHVLVSRSGYECLADRTGKFHITDRSEDESGRSYRPLDQPALYARFAGLGTEPSAVLEFVDQFGFLEHGERSHHSSGHLSEPWYLWVQSIRELRAALEFHKLLQTNQVKKLAEFVRVVAVDPDRPDLMGTYRNSDPLRNTVPMIIVVDPFFPERRLSWVLLSKGDIADVRPDVTLHIRDYLMSVINDRLRAGVKLHMLWDSTESRFRIRQTPISLRGAIWLQFAHAVAENRRIGTCRWCGDPFEVARKSSAADRQHCTDTCKSKAYRHRKETAIAMAVDNTPEQIAEALGSDAKTVRGWIRQYETQAAKTTSDSRGNEK